MTLKHSHFEWMSAWECDLDPGHRDVVWISGPPLRVIPRHEAHDRDRSLGHLFCLQMDRRRATALVFSHERGWEVRLIIKPAFNAVRTQVCGTEDEVFACGERWKRTLEEKGWH